MKTLKKFNFTVGQSQSRYNWDQLFDGRLYQMENGVDFTAKPESLVAGIRTKALRSYKNIQVQLVDNENGNGKDIVLQASDMDAEQREAAEPKIQALNERLKEGRKKGAATHGGSNNGDETEE